VQFFAQQFSFTTRKSQVLNSIVITRKVNKFNKQTRLNVNVNLSFLNVAAKFI